MKLYWMTWQRSVTFLELVAAFDHFKQSLFTIVLRLNVPAHHEHGKKVASSLLDFEGRGMWRGGAGIR